MGTLTNTYFILDEKLQESCRKASIICPESKIEALGGCKRTPEQLCAQLNRLNQRLQSESQRYAEPIEDLRMIYDKKEYTILRKQQTYEAFREKLNVNALASVVDDRGERNLSPTTPLKSNRRYPTYVQQAMHSKYDLQEGGWCSKGVRDSYGVGCGNQSLEEAFPILFNLSVNKDGWVAEAWEEEEVGGSWGPRFNRHLNDWVVGKVESLLSTLHPLTIRRGVDDLFRWKENKNETFSVKSFYSSFSRGA
ncbi:Structural maintenance of chromosomes protein 6A [Vitis vinifera]|uniref:Structural maintenance of chromosomes protein 6A n=1 Tax=Vitis vinifera TaxID=29760 RepID=A0A438HP54_VITVI|nr:Structural maintenance of chromosomes protein 6A [Vitis vinifera]